MSAIPQNDDRMSIDDNVSVQTTSDDSNFTADLETSSVSSTDSESLANDPLVPPFPCAPTEQFDFVKSIPEPGHKNTVWPVYSFFAQGVETKNVDGMHISAISEKSILVSVSDCIRYIVGQDVNYGVVHKIRLDSTQKQFVAHVQCMARAVELGMGTDPRELMFTGNHCQIPSESVLDTVILLHRSVYESMYPPKYDVLKDPTLDINEKCVIHPDKDVYWVSSTYRVVDDVHERVTVPFAQMLQPTNIIASEVLHVRSQLRKQMTKLHNSRYSPPRYQKWVPNKGPETGNLVYQRIENVPSKCPYFYLGKVNDFSN